LLRFTEFLLERETNYLIKLNILKKMRKLASKQREFIKAYLQCLTGTKAVIIAYPRVKNRNTAGVMAYELLANPRIRKIIDDQLDRDNYLFHFKDF